MGLERCGVRVWLLPYTYPGDANWIRPFYHPVQAGAGRMGPCSISPCKPVQNPLQSGPSLQWSYSRQESGPDSVILYLGGLREWCNWLHSSLTAHLHCFIPYVWSEQSNFLTKKEKTSNCSCAHLVCSELPINNASANYRENHLLTSASLPTMMICCGGFTYK